MENLAAVPPATPTGQRGEYLPSPTAPAGTGPAGGRPTVLGRLSVHAGPLAVPIATIPPPLGARVSPVTPDLSQLGPGQSSGYSDSDPMSYRAGAPWPKLWPQ